ncbi:MAG TPA: ABC transporter substrate-binding protein [Dictyobacter sp.]|jgi:multiple sugar transport system substrate-binding protein|nr:ABC transporter substrate-binding protein [Dictyobacter sp.]
MHPEQRQGLNEIITSMQVGRISRRTFLERALALGLSTTISMSLLESCGSARGKNVIPLVWQSEYDLSNTYQQLVDDFNSSQHDIHVILQPGPGGIGISDLQNIEQNLLSARSTIVDIFSVDVIDVVPFASQRWLLPITEKQWSQAERTNYLPTAMKACSYDGQLWAAPFRIDIGMIYYRNDIVTTAPTSWEDLTKQATYYQHPEALYGYVWEGAQYEGLVCCFNEVLNGYGGSILDPQDNTRVTVDSPEAQEALNRMVQWIGTITPTDVNTFTEESARKVWQSGNAVFMRNWPYAYTDIQKSPLKGKVSLHPMLPGGDYKVGHSTIGGWQLGINAFIEPEKQMAAWKFIQYMMSEKAQRQAAIQASWIITRQNLYTDTQIISHVPFYQQLTPMLQDAQPRPMTPEYDAVSEAILFHVRQALSRVSSVSTALSAMKKDLEPLVANSTFS